MKSGYETAASIPVTCSSASLSQRHVIFIGVIQLSLCHDRPVWQVLPSSGASLLYPCCISTARCCVIPAMKILYIDEIRFIFCCSYGDCLYMVHVIV